MAEGSKTIYCATFAEKVYVVPAARHMGTHHYYCRYLLLAKSVTDQFANHVLPHVLRVRQFYASSANVIMIMKL